MSLEEWQAKLVGKVYVAPGDEAPKGKEVYRIFNHLKWFLI